MSRNPERNAQKPGTSVPPNHQEPSRNRQRRISLTRCAASSRLSGQRFRGRQQRIGHSLPTPRPERRPQPKPFSAESDDMRLRGGGRTRNSHPTQPHGSTEAGGATSQNSKNLCKSKVETMENLPQQTEWTPSLPERSAHREWIGGRILTLLSHYWREDDPVELTAAIGRDWADVLEGLPQDAIQSACLKHMRTSQRKPTPAAIYQLAIEAMPRPRLVRAPVAEPPRPPRCTPEQAAEIMRRAGFRPKTFGGQDEA